MNADRLNRRLIIIIVAGVVVIVICSYNLFGGKASKSYESTKETYSISSYIPKHTYNADKAIKLKLVSVTSPCRNGKNATVKISGKPDTRYFIEVIYSSGASKAAGLGPKTSDNKGNVSWTWRVGSNTKEGEHPIIITGGGEELTLSFETHR
ncbi:MAG: hypothetical protein GX628_05250 [Clostridiales bacterium]|nr:hypothetical protein [Clostridiales bacterium]